MRRAWEGALALPPRELARTALVAFKANRREAARRRAVQRRCLCALQAAARRNAERRALGQRIKEVGLAGPPRGPPRNSAGLGACPTSASGRVTPLTHPLAPRPAPQARQRRTKEGGLAAFARFARASQLIAAAGAARLWRRRALALGALSAWRGDGLHALCYTLWQRWRARAVGRLRLRAFLAAHMARWAEGGAVSRGVRRGPRHPTCALRGYP
jgi:hypothetical protein